MDHRRRSKGMVPMVLPLFHGPPDWRDRQESNETLVFISSPRGTGESKLYRVTGPADQSNVKPCCNGLMILSSNQLNNYQNQVIERRIRTIRQISIWTALIKTEQRWRSVNFLFASELPCKSSSRWVLRRGINTCRDIKAPKNTAAIIKPSNGWWNGKTTAAISENPPINK